ncbi:ATP-binding cassette domain-containing protein [Agrobacterium sp. AGB01]|uniref:ABC transporter ATP-binding protein n=1 Tax=Agrobacterium sp. AGB01 TaxID=2769302 RepID=UPI001783DDD9|nr:polysaccharide ABC transporter ATP-binding protein [Agrobacterium sp. AGB01]MBD9388306.1 ATP-binding cassette domain-containing protein [Agrobacterium sp. AGB01]
MSPIISVNGIGKRYQLNGSGPGHDTLRDLLASVFKGKKIDADQSGQPSQPREFWALNDVSFDVNEGEVVGIIGRNGAGKSTLLKVLSQITTPTSGEAILNGRVGSLLEVGTGFHPELTGRENVFFNGTILGLRKHEIKARFDEIVAFSGVEGFIDTPIKRYSSGMKMRLAFSVAAHLEPEIMIIDEVLAVGDVDFQNKCLGKMRDVASAGRTVLFVSHNMNAVMQLCSRIIWMERGRLKADSTDVQETCARYLMGEDGKLQGFHSADVHGPLDCDFFSLKTFRLTDMAGETLDHPIPGNREFGVEIDLDIHRLSPLLNFGCVVIDEHGQHVFWSVTTDKDAENWPELKIGHNTIRTTIPAHFLNEGRYRVDFFASLHGQGWFSEPGNTPVSVFLQVSGGLSPSPYWRARRPGIVAPVLDWVAD